MYYVFIEFIDSTGLNYIMFAHNIVALRNEKKKQIDLIIHIDLIIFQKTIPAVLWATMSKIYFLPLILQKVRTKYEIITADIYM